MRRLATVAVAAMTSAALLAGCSGGKGSDNSAGSTADAAVKGVVNASTHKGGTITYEMSDAPESFDPGNMYYAYMWNFSRLYARPLTTFSPGTGDKAKLVPDLAESLGKSSDGGRTWTYKIRKGVKFQDGSTVTSADVKYGVERSNFARDVLSLGPNYFQTLLTDNPGKYKGPYKDKSKAGLKSIETPDDRTIVFHLKKPFSEFDYLATVPQTAAVQQTKDKGAEYGKVVQSTGSYKISDYQEGKSVTLVRNPQWSAASDPLRKQYPDKIVVKLKVAQSTIDKDLQSGAADVDLQAKGVDAQTQAQLLTDPQKKAHTDNVYGSRLVYMAMDTKVAPFDKVECRKAVELAVDKKAAQTAMGGPVRGDLASTVMPVDLPDHKKYDPYPQKYDGKNLDLTEAKKHWAKCGAGHVSTTITARGDRQDEVDGATSIVDSLKKIGIDAHIQQYPSGKYFSDYAGVPEFNKKHKVGLMMMQWGSDFPTGYGFLNQIVNGAAISQSGNNNLAELNDPKINKLMDDATGESDAAARTAKYQQADELTMAQAVYVPLTYFKILSYRSPNLTNVVTTPAYSGQYDYLNLGKK